MYSKLVLAVLLVTLTWLSAGSYGSRDLRSTNSSAPSNSASNCTASNSTWNCTASNTTSNCTASNSTSNCTASNSTSLNTTTAAPNMTMTTVAPPLVFNSLVTALTTNLSNTGCGSQKLCVFEPSSCTPSAGSCFFISSNSLGGQNFQFELAGESDGYLAASVSTDSTLGGNDTTYVCANNNGSIVFFGAVLNNGQLIKQNVSANNVKGKASQNLIQCLFDATVPAQSTRSSAVSLGISTGTFDPSTGSLGPPTPRVLTNAVDLSNPSSPVVNLLASNSTNTTSNAMKFQQTLAQALLISAGMVGLSLL